MDKTNVWLITTNTGNVRQIFSTKARVRKALKRAGYVVGRFIDDYAPFYLSNSLGEISTGYIVKMKVY